MGIEGLYKFLCTECELYAEPYALQNTKLIVDGWSTCHHLLRLSQNRKKISLFFGDNYYYFHDYVENFFRKLLSSNVDMIVIFRGTWVLKNFNVIHKKLVRHIIQTYDQFASMPYNNSNSALFIRDVFLDVIKKLNIKYFICTYSSQCSIATAAKILNIPLLTANSDFFLYGVDCIFLRHLTFQTNERSKSSEISCKILRPYDVIKNFPIKDIALLPLLSTLLDNDIDQDTLYKFFNINPSPSDHRIEECFTLIRAGINWLGCHSLQSAIDELLPLITNCQTGKIIETPKESLESKLDEFCSMPTYLMHRFKDLSSFSIDEKQINNARSKFAKYNFCDLDGKLLIVKDNINIYQDDEKYKVFEEKIVPAWLIQDYMVGKFASFIISMIENGVYFTWVQLENIEYPSVYDICYPLIILIYRLAISCRLDEQVKPLLIVIREQFALKNRTIMVDKYPETLETLRKSSIEQRLMIISNALGVKDPSTLNGLPKNWLMYVATIIYWMQPKSEPKKNKNHLDVLLLTMFFNIVIKKFGNVKYYDHFMLQFHEQIAEINNTKIFSLYNYRLSVSAALEEITRNDALIAAQFFLSILGNKVVIYENDDTKQNDIINQDATHKDQKIELTTLKNMVHVYSQFQCCFKFAKNLNGLLDFPYHQTDISELYNGTLIYNLHIDLQNHDDIDAYVAEKLKYSPSIIRAFALLKTQVNSLLY